MSTQSIDLEAILIPIALFAMIVLIVYFVVSRYHAERMELIKHGINPMKYRIHVPGRGAMISGIIFLALGIGGITSILLVHPPSGPESMGMAVVFYRTHFNTLMFSVAGILAGIGFIIYWKVSAPERERVLKMKEQLLSSSDPDFKSEAKPLE